MLDRFSNERNTSMATMPTLRELLNAGVHFGHKTSRWHPKMDRFIFTSKSGVHVINLEKTYEQLDTVVKFMKKEAADGKVFVFVGTKKQASLIIKKAAINCGMPYVNNRWVGGALTNFDNIKNAIDNFKKQKEILETEKDKMSKKELSKISDKVEKSERLFGGLVDLTKKPDIIILLGAHDEKNALKEANIENVPIIALVDSNSDPTEVTFPIPGNDDATKSIELFANLFSAVIKESKALKKA